MNDESSPRSQHQELRELLGGFALGHLPESDNDRLQAHLDGCADCRAELAEVQSVRAHLDLVDQAWAEELLTPAAGLGDRIQHQVEGEARRATRSLRTRRAVVALVSAAAVVALAAGGFGLGRATAPPPSPAALEAVTLQPSATSEVTIADAALVAHTWGVELQFAGSGFAEGKVFKAFFVDREGNRVAAGQFVGTGTAEMTCRLQSSPLREEVVEVVILNSDQTPVARAEF